MSPARRAAGALAVVAATLALSLTGWSSPVSAHAVLRYSSPAASSVVPTPPDRVELGFSESVEASLSSIRLFGSDRREIAIGRTVAVQDKPDVVTAALPTLGDGTYVVVWRVTSADGHPLSGAYSFEIGKSDSGGGYGLTESVLESVGGKSPLGGPLAGARFLAFTGFVLLIGAFALSWGTRLLGSTRAVVTVLAGVFLMLVGSFGVLVMQGSWVTGGGWGDVWSLTDLAAVARSRLGIALLMRAGLSLLWLSVVRDVRREGWTDFVGLQVRVLAVLTAGTFSFSGHAGAESNAWFFAPLDMIHLLAVGTWAGGIALLIVAGRDIESGPHGGLVVGRFSQVATLVLPLAVVTGVVQSLHLSDGVGSWSGSSYGWFLIGKIALVVAVFVLGARARGTVRAGRGSEVVRVVRTEAAVAVVVLALTAGLVSTSPRSEEPDAGTFATTLVERNILAEVSVVPPRTGASELHLLFTPPGGTVTPLTDVQVRVAMPSRDEPSVLVLMTEVGPNHWSGVVRFPYAGEWSVEIVAKPDPGSEVRYSTVVKVRG